MYKFTNGFVVFDKETRDKFIKAGYKLEVSIEKKEKIEAPINEEINENDTSDESIKEEYSRNNKKTSKHRK